MNTVGLKHILHTLGFAHSAEAWLDGVAGVMFSNGPGDPAAVPIDEVKKAALATVAEELGEGFAEKEKIEPSQEKILQRVGQLAAQYKTPVKKLVKQLQEFKLSLNLLVKFISVLRIN